MHAQFLCRDRCRRGLTLVDVLGALLVVGLAFTGLFAANARSVGILRSSKQAAVASKCLQQRIEQIRNFNWTQITDSAPLIDLYSIPPLPAVELPSFSEKVTISVFPPDATVASLVVNRALDGTTSMVTENPNLNDSMSVRVDVQISWTGTGGATRLRETSVILTNGGLGR